MGVFKRGSTWWIDYYDHGRRIREAAGKTKAIAEKVLTKKKNDVTLRSNSLPVNEKIKFFNAAAEYIEKHSKPNKSSWRKTDFFYLKRLIPFFGNYNITDISPALLAEYRSERIKDPVKKGKGQLVSKAQINREVSLLRAILNKMVKWGRLSSNPLGKVEMFKEQPKQRILTIEEMNQLVSAAKPPLKQIIMVALNTGMRKSEILGLRWDAVNLDTGEILLFKTKAQKMRSIPVNDALSKLFQEMKLSRAGRTYIFEGYDQKSKKYTGVPQKDIHVAWGTLIKRTGIKGVRFHDLRHTFATWSLHRGGDLTALRDVLGHSTIVTTNRYAGSVQTAKKHLVDVFQIGEAAGEKINADFKKKSG